MHSRSHNQRSSFTSRPRTGQTYGELDAPTYRLLRCERPLHGCMRQHPTRLRVANVLHGHRQRDGPDLLRTAFNRAIERLDVSLGQPGRHGPPLRRLDGNRSVRHVVPCLPAATPDTVQSTPYTGFPRFTLPYVEPPLDNRPAHIVYMRIYSCQGPLCRITPAKTCCV